jgi:hypothetical protein
MRASPLAITRHRLNWLAASDPHVGFGSVGGRRVDPPGRLPASEVVPCPVWTRVDPSIQVESATWSAGGQLDWWVKERREWWGPDGRQRWITAADLRLTKET